MSRPLRLLLLEDNPHDAELVRNMLATGGLVCDTVVVESRADFASALARERFDLIISDFSLPSYDGLSALLLAREQCPDVPYIFFSATIGEDAAIEALKTGALDYVLKQHPSRLVSAVRRALDDTRERAERKKVEETLRRIQERLSGIFESSKDAIVYSTLDGLFLDMNPAFETLTGYAKAELLTKTHQALIPMEYRRVEADRITTVIRTGEATEFEKEYVRKDGTRVPVSVTVSLVRRDDGNPVGLAAIIKDITERKIVERRRAAQYAVTKVLAESSMLAEAASKILQVVCESLDWEVGGLWRVDEAANVLRFVELWHRPDVPVPAFEAHSRQMTFAPGVGMPGRVWASGRPAWIPDVVADANFPRAPVAAQERLHASCGFPIVGGNKITGVLEFFSHAIREPDHDLLQMLGAIGSQIGQFTERQLLEAQFRQAQKLDGIGQLAGGIAHDFNNLLTVINGYSELALQTLPPAHAVRAQVEQIREAGKRAALLTRQILVFSRRQTLAPVVFNLNGAVAHMEHLLRRLIGEHITFVTSPDPLLGHVKADQGQIEQVIMNLAVNARDAMPHGGTLTIETRNVELDASFVCAHEAVPPGPYVKLSVRDTGCGMDAATQARIFEPFFTTKGPDQGTGLGLSTVYGIVVQSGGIIRVESQPGNGSTFNVYLPRVAGDPASAWQVGVGTDVPRGSETVLLVEDEDGVRALIRQVLSQQGYIVLEARQGAKAQEICGQYDRPIHLLLTDLIMPGMNGRELAERLRVTRPEMKTLFMSGYANNVLGQQGALPPGMDFLPKPFAPDTLLRRVREALDAPQRP